jgi:folate-binding protein YgfZ
MCSAAASPPSPVIDESSSILSSWAQFLASQAADRAEASTASELRHMPSGCVVCDLTAHYGLIEATGPDARAFLHGQLSSDLDTLGPDRAQLSTYSSPKGRVLATLLLWRSADDLVLQLPAAIVASIAKRLSMFVLRSKLRLTVSERYIRLGVAGDQAAATLQAAGYAVPETDFALVALDAAGATAPDRLLRLPGGRYELVVSDPARAIESWQRLCSGGAQGGNGAAWQWASIRSGIADIVTETQDQFVLQMLNYDVLEGVSFTKGCYPGQEIVARTQYRGEIKRRTWLLHSQSGEEPVAAQPIYAGGSPEQPIGTVLGAAAAPAGGFDALACVHLDLAAGNDLRLGSVDGPPLQRLPLPYALPAPR